MPFPEIARPHWNIARKSLAAFGVVVVLLFPSAPAAQADTKKILMVIPNAMKRTAVNMVTFRNRESALMQWVDMAATLADAETTRRSINRGSSEYNPFLGRRPSAARTYATLLTIGFSYGTMTQVVQERVEKPRPFKLGLTAMAVTAHSFVAYHNTTVCPGNTVCNVPAN